MNQGNEDLSILQEQSRSQRTRPLQFDGILKLPTIHRTEQEQQEIKGRVSGPEDSLPPETPVTPFSFQGIPTFSGSKHAVNKVLSKSYSSTQKRGALDLLFGACVEFKATYAVLPYCLCVSPELKPQVEEDMQKVLGETFSGTIPFPNTTQRIHVYFLESVNSASIDCYYSLSKEDQDTGPLPRHLV